MISFEIVYNCSSFIFKLKKKMVKHKKRMKPLKNYQTTHASVICSVNEYLKIKKDTHTSPEAIFNLFSHIICIYIYEDMLRYV